MITTPGLNFMETSAKVKTVEFAPIGIWKLDSDLNIIEANPAVAAQLGMPRESVIGKMVQEVLPFINKDLFEACRVSGKTVTHKQVAAHQQDRLLPTYWEVSIGPIRRDDFVVGFVLSTVEVTERERLIQQREDFIAALSHNLKTPLVGTNRILESLLQGALGDLNQPQSEVLNQLKRSNLHLLGMVQDILEVYRYETNNANLRFQYCEVEQLVQSCVEKFAAVSEAKQIALLPLVRPRLNKLFVDRAAFTRLLSNLLDNAIKFTEPGGIVEIECMAKNTDILITVKDNGIGMEVDDPDRLFQRFWQGEGKAYPAVTGLGLYLSRQIVNAHNGTISVESALGKGTKVSVQLPTSPRSTNA